LIGGGGGGIEDLKDCRIKEEAEKFRKMMCKLIYLCCFWFLVYFSSDLLVFPVTNLS